jgi:hypothetical protein
MGLDKINKARMGGEHNPTASWMEIEERRRIWWAILTLDRSVTSYPNFLYWSFRYRKSVILGNI